MKELPSESCDPVCLRKILKHKVWAMRRATLGKHLEVRDKEERKCSHGKVASCVLENHSVFHLRDHTDESCSYKAKKGTCKTWAADGLMDYLHVPAIEDKHWCNTKNYETVTGVRNGRATYVVVFDVTCSYYKYICRSKTNRKQTQVRALRTARVSTDRR